MDTKHLRPKIWSAFAASKAEKDAAEKVEIPHPKLPDPKVEWSYGRKSNSLPKRPRKRRQPTEFEREVAAIADPPAKLSPTKLRKWLKEFDEDYYGRPRAAGLRPLPKGQVFKPKPVKPDRTPVYDAEPADQHQLRRMHSLDIQAPPNVTKTQARKLLRHADNQRLQENAKQSSLDPNSVAQLAAMKLHPDTWCEATYKSLTLEQRYEQAGLTALRIANESKARLERINATSP